MSVPIHDGAKLRRFQDELLVKQSALSGLSREARDQKDHLQDVSGHLFRNCRPFMRVDSQGVARRHPVANLDDLRGASRDELLYAGIEPADAASLIAQTAALVKIRKVIATLESEIAPLHRLVENLTRYAEGGAA